VAEWRNKGVEEWGMEVHNAWQLPRGAAGGPGQSTHPDDFGHYS